MPFEEIPSGISSNLRSFSLMAAVGDTAAVDCQQQMWANLLLARATNSRKKKL